MGRGNGVTGKRSGNGVTDEQTSLLGGRKRRAGVDGNEDTWIDGQSGGEEVISNDGDDEDKANQQVGKVRAILISISVFGLIFLQGVFSLSRLSRNRL